MATSRRKTSGSFANLLADVRACTRCAAELPLGPRPVLQIDPAARILIAGQAPGARVHASGVPFADASGQRLRDWLGVSEEEFYDPRQVAILPMGFCYPGTGRSGDVPPRPECAPAWREALLARLRRLELTVVLGQYAQAYHGPGSAGSVTDRVRDWQSGWPTVIALPHPSPRNNRWLAGNPWFARDVLPALRQRVREALG
jgi:uracil-DNA glycosylase